MPCRTRKSSIDEHELLPEPVVGLLVIYILVGINISSWQRDDDENKSRVSSAVSMSSTLVRQYIFCSLCQWTSKSAIKAYF